MRRMQENGWLDAARFERARASAARSVRRAGAFARRISWSWFCSSRRKAATPSCERRSIFGSTNRSERILRDRLAQLRDQNVHNGAAVVIDNASGDVIALVGSENYSRPGRAGEWRVGAALGWFDPEAVYLFARARTRRDPGHDGGGCADEFSDRPTDFIGRRITIAVATVR